MVPWLWCPGCISHMSDSISGDYMHVKVQSFSAIAGMLVSMTTPAFIMTATHCLTFEYEVAASADTPVLEIHSRMTDYMLSGRRIWTSQEYSMQRNKASLTLLAANDSRNVSYVFDFVGILERPKSTVIRVANVEFYDGQCEDRQTLPPADGDSGNTVDL